MNSSVFPAGEPDASLVAKIDEFVAAQEPIA